MRAGIVAALALAAAALAPTGSATVACVVSPLDDLPRCVCVEENAADCTLTATTSGRAEGQVAASARGESRGGIAASGTGNAHGSTTGASATGDATGCRPDREASSSFVLLWLTCNALSGTGDAGAFSAVSLRGNADGQLLAIGATARCETPCFSLDGEGNLNGRPLLP